MNARPLAPAPAPQDDAGAGLHEVSALSLSDSNPFLHAAQAEAQGRPERERLLATRAAAGRPPGVDLHAAAAVVWRRKVALAWAPQLEELLRSEGVR